MAERRALHTYLSDTAHDAWHQLAEANGVSATGLIEALGQEIAADIDKAEADGGDAGDIRQAWVKAARRIDAARRRRGGSR